MNNVVECEIGENDEKKLFFICQHFVFLLPNLSFAYIVPGNYSDNGMNITVDSSGEVSRICAGGDDAHFGASRCFMRGGGTYASELDRYESADGVWYVGSWSNTINSSIGSTTRSVGVSIERAHDSAEFFGSYSWSYFQIHYGDVYSGGDSQEVNILIEHIFLKEQSEPIVVGACENGSVQELELDLSVNLSDFYIYNFSVDSQSLWARPLNPPIKETGVDQYALNFVVENNFGDSCQYNRFYIKYDSHDLGWVDIRQEPAPDTSSLTVSIGPFGTRDAGAMWRILGTENWRESDVEIDLPIGSSTIEFKALIIHWSKTNDFS